MKRKKNNVGIEYGEIIRNGPNKNRGKVDKLNYDELKNIFDDKIIYSLNVIGFDRKHGSQEGKFYCSDFTDAFEYIKKNIESVKNINKAAKKKFLNIYLELAKKRNLKLEYDYNELIDEKEIKCKIMRTIEKEDVPNELKTAIRELFKKKSFIEVIKEEISVCEKFFEGENSFFLLDNGEGSVSNPRNRLEYISRTTGEKLILDFCYRFYEKDENTLKVVFDDEIVKNPEYKVIIRDTDGNILNEGNIIFNPITDLNKNDRVIDKSSFGGIMMPNSEMLLKDKNDKDMAYWIPISNNCGHNIHGERERYITLDIKNGKHCNFTIQNETGKGPKKCTFFSNNIDGFLTKIGIDKDKYDFFLNEDTGNKSIKNNAPNNISGVYKFTVKGKDVINENTSDIKIKKGKTKSWNKIPNCCCVECCCCDNKS